MNDSQIVALTHENEQLREKICQQQMQAGSNSVYLTRMQQKLTASQEKLMDSQSALIKAKWKNLLIQIIDRQTRQAIRLGLTDEIRETNSTKNSLQELNAKLLAQLRENQQLLKEKDKLRTLAVELLHIQRELEESNFEIERQKLNINRFQSNSLAVQQELNKLRQQTDGVHLHLHVDNTTGYVSPIFFIPSSNTFLYDGKNPIQAPMVPVPETSTSTLEHLLIPIVCLTKQFGKVFQTCPVTQKQFVSAVVGSYLGFESTASLNDVPLKYRPLAYTLSKAKKMTKAVCTKPKADSALPAELLSHHHPAAEEYSSSISVNSKQTVNTQAVVAHVHGLHLQ